MNQKTQFLNPKFLFQALYKSTYHLYSRLIQESADRTGRPTCTNVHAYLYWRTADRAGRPLQRAVLSGKFGRPPGSTVRELNSQLQWVGRPRRSTVAPTVRNPTVGGRPRRSTGSTDRSQRLVFWQPINWGSCHCLKPRFQESFEPVFPILSEEFFSTKQRANISYQKGSFYKEC